MPYAITKAAQLQLVKCLGESQGPKIRVNTVLPGLLLTEWVRQDMTSCMVLSTLSIFILPFFYMSNLGTDML